MNSRDDWIAFIGLRILAELLCIMVGFGGAFLHWALENDRQALAVFLVCALVSRFVRPTEEQKTIYIEFQKHRAQFGRS